MNTNALRDALALLLRTSTSLPVDVSTDAARTPARVVGEMFQAKVVAQLANSRSLIEIQGTRIDVKLPVPARLGEALDLKVRTLEPRLTFELLTKPPGPADEKVALSDSVRRLVAVLDRLSGPAAAPAAGTAGSAPAPGKSAALPAAAHTAAAAPAAGAPAAGSGMSAAATAAVAAPVLAAPPLDTALLAASLRTALGRSGLSYESHQAQWVAGERPLEELMREPQAGLKRDSEPVHQQAVPLVRQQLEWLNTRQLMWHGEVWPDQSLEWQIEEDAKGEHAGEDAVRVWKTSLRLDLPRLGNVTATLAIHGDDVRLSFFDLSEETRSAVKTEQVALREAFVNAGLALREIKLEP